MSSIEDPCTWSYAARRVAAAMGLEVGWAVMRLMRHKRQM